MICLLSSLNVFENLSRWGHGVAPHSFFVAMEMSSGLFQGGANLPFSSQAWQVLSEQISLANGAKSTLQAGGTG